MPAGHRDYLLCGWHVRSDLALPELPQWPETGTGADAVDVVIEETPVPDRLERAAHAGAWLSVGDDGSVLLQVPQLVRLHVLGGHTIRVQRLCADDQGWRLFLLGSALGYLCLQRGVFPLHAASVRLGGRTLAIAGHSGAGKSTLAAALLNRGHGLLSDDLTVIRDATPDGGIEVLPAFPRLKLWRDTLQSLQLPSNGALRVRHGMDKFDLRPRTGFDPAPSALDGIVVLHDAPALQLQRYPRSAAVPVVHGYLARPQVAVQLGLRGATFVQAAAIARQVPVWRLQRPRHFEALEATLDLVEAQLGP